MAPHCRRGFRARTLVVGPLLLVLLGAAPPALADIGARPVATGLAQPVGFTFGPGPTLWYVEKATGEVRVVDLRSGRDRLFSRVSRIDAAGERGLLGVALHPRYPSRPFVYVYATRRSGGDLENQLLRIREEDGVGVRRRVLLSSPVGSATNHNGGRILFGPDGMLYVVIGDGAEPDRAQRLADLRGKVLRVRPDGAVPATNPFDSPVWAFGLRNSFGFAFDPRTDRLWLTDNGPACNDEVNRIRAGRNYGWGPSATCEGPAPRNTNRDGPRPVLPELYLPDAVGITGIAFCEGCGLGRRSEGRLFFSAVTDGLLRRVALGDRRTTVRSSRVVYRHDRGIISIEVGPRGRLYFSDMTGIYRLVRT
ncbi:MAG: hypothetical protein KatS3mg014_0466 [Actinomycetota bacterium]|nr:MAG: hypothetical protein KatS3mg014_0466 [Actinomycetota bacterium]